MAHPSRNKRTSDEDLLADMRRIYDEVGPEKWGKQTYDRLGCVSSWTVHKRFGTFNDACRKAKIPTRPPGPPTMCGVRIPLRHSESQYHASTQLDLFAPIQKTRKTVVVKPRFCLSCDDTLFTRDALDGFRLCRLCRAVNASESDDDMY